MDNDGWEIVDTSEPVSELASETPEPTSESSDGWSVVDTSDSEDKDDNYSIWGSDGDAANNEKYIEGREQGSKDWNEEKSEQLAKNEVRKQAHQKVMDKRETKRLKESQKLADEEAELNKEAARGKKEKFKDAKPGNLVPTAWYNITGKNFTTRSLASYFNKRKEESKADGTYVNSSQFKNQMYGEFQDKGASTLDLQELSQMSRGVPTSAEVWGPGIGEAVALLKEPDYLPDVKNMMPITEYLSENVADPIMNQSKQNVLAATSLLVDLARFNPLVDGDKQQKAADVVDMARGYEKGLQDSYEAEYGASGVNIIQSATEIIPLMMYSPTKIGGALSWSKMAFADGTYMALNSKMKGSDTMQAGAMGVASFMTTKAFGKVIDIGTKLYHAQKVKGNQFKDFTDIGSIPKKYQEQIRELQKMNGWSDDEAMSIIKGFKNSTEEGKLNAIDSIRLLAQNSHDQSGRSIFQESILYNRKAANKFLAEANDRSQDIISNVSRNTELGKIVHSSTYKHRNNTSIDWVAVVNKAEDKGINMETTMMRRIRKNAELFEDFDTAYHKQIINKGIGEEKTSAEVLSGFAKELIEIQFGRTFAGWTGGAYFAPVSVPKKGAKYLMDKVLSPKIVGISDTIRESFAKGTTNINPILLRQELKKARPRTPDNQIDDIVEDIIIRSQKSKRTLIKEKSEALSKTHKRQLEDRLISQEHELLNRSDELGISVEKATEGLKPGTAPYVKAVQKANKAEEVLVAQYSNKLEDIALSSKGRGEYENKMVQLIQQKAKDIRTLASKNGEKMTQMESKKLAADRIDRILKECK